MDIILKTTLFIHIAAGIIALLTGLMAMLFKKGGKTTSYPARSISGA